MRDSRDNQGQSWDNQGKYWDSRDKTGTAGTTQGKAGTKQGQSWAKQGKLNSLFIPDCSCLVPAWVVPVFFPADLYLLVPVLFLFCLCWLYHFFFKDNRDSPFLSLPVPDCPCMSLFVLACPCLSLSVPVWDEYNFF